MFEEDKDSESVQSDDQSDEDKPKSTEVVLGKRQTETQQFKKFHSARRNHVFQSLNLAEQDRFNSHMEAFGDKIRSQVESFINSLPGNKPKLAPHVSQLITSSAKIHAGQLVEHARAI